MTTATSPDSCAIPYSPTTLAARHRRFRMTKDAWAIIERQPRSSEYIFPYKAKSIGIAFKRACTAVGTPNLTFDNLRREGMIHLFERGMNISEVRQHSLCDTLETLQRCQAAAKPNLRTQGRAMAQNRSL